MDVMINVLVPNLVQSQGGAPRQAGLPSQGEAGAAFQGILLGMLTPEGATGQNPLVGEEAKGVPGTNLSALTLIPVPESPDGEDAHPDPVDAAQIPAELMGVMLSATAPTSVSVLTEMPTGEEAVPQPLLTGGEPAEGQALDQFVQRALQSLASDQEPVAAPGARARSGEEPSRFADLVRLLTKNEPTGEQAQGASATGTPGQATASEAQALRGQAPTTSTPSSANQPSSPESAGQAAEQAAQAALEQPTVAVTGSRQEIPPSIAASEAEPAPPPTPVQPEQVVRQVSRFLKVTIEGKRSEVRFQLHPEHLGQIAVRLIMQEGIVRANLTAQNQAVKAALEANLDQLRTRLADQGFRVEQIHVAVSGDGASGHSHHPGQREQQRQPERQGAGAPWQPEGEESAGVQPRSAKSAGMPGSTGRRIDSLA